MKSNYEHKPDRGSLFRNEEKRDENDRDYVGSINIGGTDYWLSGSVKTSAKGTKYLALSAKPKNEARTAKKAAVPFDDAVGF
jgi:hypothetical protein